MGVLTPPMTPPQTPPELRQPAPVEIENYVTRTLRNQEILPPLDRHNWFKEMIWLHVAFLILTPVAGFWGAYHTKLLWKTGIFSVFYYFFTGLGESQILLCALAFIL